MIPTPDRHIAIDIGDRSLGSVQIKFSCIWSYFCADNALCSTDFLMSLRLRSDVFQYFVEQYIGVMTDETISYQGLKSES